MRENTRQYASQVLKANGTPNKRFSWFFGTTSKSGSPTKKQSSIDLPGSSAQTSTKRQPPAVDLPISDEMPELVPAINPEPFLTIKTDVISMPLPVASTGIRTPLPRSPTPNSLKFDTLDSVRLSSRLEKVVSRSSSMNFSDVTSSEGTRTPRADMCHSRPVLGGPRWWRRNRLCRRLPSPNQPGLIRRLWRTGVSWVGGISKDVEWVGRYEEVRPMRS
ncbi:hypothetical protein BC829DRAFT_398772 [Chytridium lagenaria]|nr:hypothetical protein BC829DRAFT_398772 [Chytridium lagenaria]